MLPKNKIARHFFLLFGDLEKKLSLDYDVDRKFVAIKLKLRDVLDIQELKEWAGSVQGVVWIFDNRSKPIAYACPKRGAVPIEANAPLILDIEMEAGKSLRKTLYTLLSHPQVEAVL